MNARVRAAAAGATAATVVEPRKLGLRLALGVAQATWRHALFGSLLGRLA